MKSLLIQAIQARQVISFVYSGLARLAEPHTLGTSRTGNLALRCFQTQGGHVKPGHAWDFCDVDKMVNVQVTGQTFAGPRPGYKKGDSHMSQIFAEL